MKLHSTSHFYVYLVTNDNRSQLEPGVTGDLSIRLNEYESAYREQYKDKPDGEFCRHLVWFNQYADVHEALAAEDRLQSLSAKKRLNLVEESNPTLRFMNAEISSVQSFSL
jgi:putative endonuclease